MTGGTVGRPLHEIPPPLDDPGVIDSPDAAAQDVDRPGLLRARRGNGATGWRKLGAACLDESHSFAAGLWLLATVTAAQDTPNGVVLVAKPELVDPNFRETVVLVTRHPGGGAVGVILNRPTRILASQLLPEHEGLRGRTDRLFAGGPVAPRSVVAVSGPGSARRLRYECWWTST
jgi:Uncharacterized ACR, COG1678